jgi:hypothetical protein
MRLAKYLLIAVILSCLKLSSVGAQEPKIYFGKSLSLSKAISNTSEKDMSLSWVNVNTAPDTWHVEKDILVCSGQPIGVMRSEKQYDNFILHIEWMHTEAGGNSGTFVWSNANPPEDTRLPDGVEVQMLELDWVNLNKRDGVTPPVAYVHGELFGVGGVKTIPDNPRGTRSKSVENRCKGKGEWNTYDVVCVDGVIKLSVNGKFVNGISGSSQRKGYICLESEGAKILFRNISVIELPAGNTLAASHKPISLNPQNPHYFQFRGKPAILIGSTEHYGAVMNLDFDYTIYLDELASSGLNITRTFSGIYVEPQGAFGIEKNTMAPANGRFISPWARSTVDGYINGGNKFDLTKWDESYFVRLKDFIAEAGKRDIVVELDLFSNFYDTIQWKLSPLNSRNNVNGIGNIRDHKEVLSLRHRDVLDVQEKMARKIVNELKDFDNLYYEICNEPYFGDTLALREWEDYMTDVVVDAEKDFLNKHLISNNIANNYKLVKEARKGVSVYNFHYAQPPVTVPMNYHLNMVLGDNETGFSGTVDATYRKEAWNFILSGGALFNHLDYSFTSDNEDGSFVIKKGQPGGGGKTIRGQFRILAEFMKSVNYISMKPVSPDQVRIGGKENVSVNGLTEDGKAFALYLSRKGTASAASIVEINLPAGSYRLAWIDTKTAGVTHTNLNNHPGGWAQIKTPDYSEDIALKLVKAE